MKGRLFPRRSSGRQSVVWSGAVAGVVLAFSLAGADGSAADPRATEATYTADEIKDRLATAQRLIRSIHLIYRAPAAEGMGAPSGGYVRRDVIAKEPDLLFHSSAHGHDALAWKDDPFQQQTLVLQDCYFNSFPINRAYFTGPLEPGAALPGTLNKEFAFVAIGLWPFSSRPAPRTETGPIVLIDVATCTAFKDVAPIQEFVEGRLCHVLSRDREDFLWLDVERGCALMRRETRDPIQGNVVQRFEFRQHAEDLPGLWLPRVVRNTQYRPEGGNGGLGDSSFSATIELQVVGVNNVDDSYFAFDPPRGALLLGQDLASSRQVRSGGVDHLDNLVRWTKQTMRKKPSHQVSSLPSVSLATSVAVASVLGFWIWRRSRAAATGRQ